MNDQVDGDSGGSQWSSPDYKNAGPDGSSRPSRRGGGIAGDWRPQQGQAYQRPFDPNVTETERTWAVFMHLSGLLLGLGFIAPLVLWVIKKDDSPFLDDHGREATCFQITLLIYSIMAAISMLFCVGIILVPAVAIFGIVASIMMAIRANHGEYVRYPMCIRFF